MKAFYKFFTFSLFVITLFGIVGCANPPEIKEDKSDKNDLSTLQGDLLGDRPVPSEPADSVNGVNDNGVNEYLFGHKYGHGSNYSTN